MHEPLRIEVARQCDADDLTEFLADHGFAAQQSASAVEVDYADPDSLAVEVDRALAEWLATGNRDLVPVRVGGRLVALRPPAG